MSAKSAKQIAVEELPVTPLFVNVFHAAVYPLPAEFEASLVVL